MTAASSTAAGWVDHRTARLILLAFLFTFILSRIVVLLIMLRWIPTLYLRTAGTHVHHLNYGIFLLSFVGGYLLLARPTGHGLTLAIILYAIGLALTFDEFGLWLHLGGPYWQRASFDAVLVIAALLGLLAFAPTLAQFRPRHWLTAALLLIAVALFSILLARSWRFANERLSPILHHIETRGPAE